MPGAPHNWTLSLHGTMLQYMYARFYYGSSEAPLTRIHYSVTKRTSLQTNIISHSSLQRRHFTEIACLVILSHTPHETQA